MSNERSVGEVFGSGLWSNNPALIQLLGLCPLLAVTTTLAYGLGLGIATIAVMTCSGFLVALVRKFTSTQTRILIYVIIIAGLVTAVDMIMHAWFFNLHRVLGLFVPLIVTNCAIIARAEAFASRNRPLTAALDGFANGLGFMLVLACMGFIRELLGLGTMFADMDMLFGSAAASWKISVHSGFLLFILPPGAFMVLGMLIALRNWLTEKSIATPVTSSAVETVS